MSSSPAVRTVESEVDPRKLFFDVRRSVTDSLFEALRLRPSLLNIHDVDGSTFLHLLASRNDIDGCKTLLSMGAEVDSLDLNKMTPLMITIHAGALGCLNLLLEYGANVHLGDVRGTTPLQMCAFRKLNFGALFLLDAGADLSEADVSGNTFVHWAAYVGDLNSLRIARNYGGDTVLTDAVDNEGNTPLHRAARAGQLQVVEYLLDIAGADPFRPLFYKTAGGGGRRQPLSDSSVASSSNDSPKAGGEGDAGGGGGGGGGGGSGAADGATSIVRGRKGISSSSTSSSDGALASTSIELTSKSSGGGGASSEGADPSTGEGTAGTSDASTSSSSSSSSSVDAEAAAQEALDIMVQSISAGGEYADPSRAHLIPRQEKLIRILKTRKAEIRAAKASLVGRAKQILARISAPRFSNRVMIPYVYFSMIILILSIWFFYVSVGSQFLFSAASLFILMTLFCWFHIYLKPIPFLDPYKVLPATHWNRLLPDLAWRYPWAEPATLPCRELNLRKRRQPAAATSASGSAGAGATTTVDYDALVDSQLLGDGQAASDALAVAMGGGSNASSAVASASFGLSQSPVQKLFAQVQEETIAVLSALGDVCNIPIPDPTLSLQNILLNSILDRVCYSCDILRPLRGKHDAATDRCYDRFDHYCPWVGAVVASGNHGLFMLYTTFQFTSNAFLFLALYAYLGPYSAFEREAAAGGGGASLESTVLANAYDLTPPLYASAILEAAAVAAASGSTFVRPSYLYLLWSSWYLLVFLIINTFSIFFATAIGATHISMSLENITSNETANKQRYVHWQTVDLAFPASADITADPVSRLPTLRARILNPFSGTWWKNFKEAFLSGGPARAVSITAIAAREATKVRGFASAMQPAMHEALIAKRAHLQRIIDMAAAAVANADSAAPAASAAQQQSHGLGAATVAALSSISMNATPASTSIDVNNPTGSSISPAVAAQMLQSLPMEVDAFSAKVNVLLLRVNAFGSNANHGHSHGGGGRGGAAASGGGGSSHGHSH